MNIAEEIYIRKEYKKKNGNMFLPKIDEVFSKLKFFKSLPQLVRYELYKSGKIVQGYKGDYLFKEGDYGDLMYVILKGRVDVRKITPNCHGIKENLLLVTLYDGTQFGELSMMTLNKRRMVTKEEQHRLEKLERKTGIVQRKVSRAKTIEKTKRSSSIIFVENTMLLAIKREIFQNLLKELI